MRFSASISIVLALALFFVFIPAIASAQKAPLLDVTYSPDPSSSGYAGTLASRPKLLNARGSSSPIAPMAATATHASKTVTVIGSQSYNYAIPILNLPGRAGMDMVLNLYYNSRIWNIDTAGSSATFNADRDFPSYGFRLDFGYLEYDVVNDQYVLTESDGGKHALPNSGNYDSTDGTYMRYTPAQEVLAYRNGHKVGYQVFPSQAGLTTPTLFRPIWQEDTNGNFIAIAYVNGHDQLISSITDTVGRVIHFNYDASNRLSTLTQNVQVSTVDPSGVHTYATFSWGTVALNYSFSLTVKDSPASGTMINVLTACTYPNGVQYSFSYGDWGIIKKIQHLSSSGLIRSYESYNFPLASSGALSDAPAYTQQTVSPDGSNTFIWNYAVTKSGTGVVTSIAITAPSGSKTVHNLNASGLISSVQRQTSAGTALRTIGYTWTTAGTGTVPSVVTTTLNDTGQQSSVHYTYDIYGNATDVNEYDFDGLVKRHVVTTFLGTNIPWWHIVNLPTQILVKDGAGNILSRTDLNYDDYTTSPMTTITGASGHDDGFNSSVTVRGNLTSMTRYSNAAAGTGAISRSFTYDTLGNTLTEQLDCCSQKTFSFSSANQYAYPNSVTRGPTTLQFTTSFTYGVDRGQILSFTDENSQQTNYGYDVMNRRISVKSPVNSVSGLQLQDNTVFGDDTASPTITDSNSADSRVTVRTFDGLGRLIQADTKNGATVISSIKYSYDGLGRRIQVSNPFAPTDTQVNTTYTYDDLDRITVVAPPSGGNTTGSYSGNAVTVTDPATKQRKSYTDALGRLIQVDEPGIAFAGVASSGTLAVNGTLRSQSGVGAAAGSGNVTIGGGAQSACCDGNGATVYDSGSVYITVNGFTDQTAYWSGSPCCPSLIAQGLATAINTDNPYVSAASSGSTVYLTAKTTGSNTNYSLSASSTYDYWGTGLFTQPSFTESPSGATLTGGANGTTVTDSGTVTVTIGSSFTASAPYGPSSNSTAAQVATALISTGTTGLNRAGSPVIATASGSNITLTYKTVGTAGNLAVTLTSSPSNATLFPGGSFSGSTNLVNGADSYSSGLAHPYSTTYTFDVLNNLLTVSQAAGTFNGQSVTGQARSYTYDSLGRVLTATTPESGTTTNYYTDANGNPCAGNPNLVCRVKDARTPTAVIKTFTYDSINRRTAVQYSDGTTPSVAYTYDTGGSGAFALDRLVKITEGSNSQTFTYDNWGRTTADSQMIDGNSYLINYGYNMVSQLTSITYPTGRVVSQNVDAIGRLSSISDGTAYLSNLTYDAAGDTLGLTLGNGIQGAFSFNDHLQLSTLRYFKSGVSTDILNLSYDYTTTAVPGNNGQIQVQHYFTSPGAEDTTKSQSFTYDPWGRLSAAQTVRVDSTPGTWSLQWAYDRLGNRLSQTLMGGNVTIGQPSFTIDPLTNHITNANYQYDGAGNMTHDASNSYTYDGANRLTQINGGAAVYTYFGPLRIKKVNGTTTTVYIYSGTKPIVEYVNGVLSKEYIYAGPQLLATVAGTSTTYHHPDHLSNRAETDNSGNIVRAFGHLPYGDGWYETGTADKFKFTSYERDTLSGETGNDYGLFRYYASGQGRFMSPDLMAGFKRNPQSLNRYSYALNDPINLTDPTGLTFECVTSTLFDGNGNAIGTHTQCTLIDDGCLGGAFDTCSQGGPPFDFSFIPPTPLPGDLFPAGRAPRPGRLVLNVLLAQEIIRKILSGNNPCADFLNSMSIANSGPSAEQVFNNTQVHIEDSYNGDGSYSGVAGSSEENSAFSNNSMNVYINSPFGSLMQPANYGHAGPPAVLHMGAFYGGGLGFQIAAMLHELAHIVGAIPADGFAADPNRTQEAANKQTMAQECDQAIKDAIQGITGVNLGVVP